jgi:hypothetical protein
MTGTSQLFEQFTAISKAGAYDALAPMAAKLQKQNEALRRALGDLIEQIDCMDGFEFNGDLPPHEEEFIWSHTLSTAKKVLNEAQS